MRSTTVLSRRGLIVGTAASIAAPAPLELRESLALGYARLTRIRALGVKIGPYIIHVKAAFE